MGKGAVERDKPHVKPQSAAEALFYRGLLFEGYESAKTGARAIVYIPTDLAAALPTYKTSYDDLGDAPDFGDAEDLHVGAIELDEDEEQIPANTTLVDDMATLLAYVQIFGAHAPDFTLSDDDAEALSAYLLDADPVRLDFLFALGTAAILIEINEGRVSTRRAEAKRWLEKNRSAQLRDLAKAWHKTPHYRELWHIDGLHPEPTGWPYDPVVARQSIVGFLADLVPQNDWWSLDEFITVVKQTEPDFQRPSGDYDSWYIRNDAGEYLNGFESWDAVEGALLEFTINGPMHWLGLTDLAVDAGRLTAYGRAFISQENWPDVPDQPEKIAVEPDGRLIISRHVSRFDRFQAMRFTEWLGVDIQQGYACKLSGEGIRRAAEQGIETGHIETFINRMLDGVPIPPDIQHLLQSWETGPAAGVTMEHLLVLRTTSPDTLGAIYNDPRFRRYLGAQLGPMAVVVRADQWQTLKDALEQEGIEVELRE